MKQLVSDINEINEKVLDTRWRKIDDEYPDKKYEIIILCNELGGEDFCYQLAEKCNGVHIKYQYNDSLRYDSFPIYLKDYTYWRPLNGLADGLRELVDT